MNILFFDIEITGHHVEYLIHIINYLKNRNLKANCIFVTNPKFRYKLRNFVHNQKIDVERVVIVHPTNGEMAQLSSSKSIQLRVKKEFHILKRFIVKYEVQCCHIMNLNKFQYIIGSRQGRNLPCKIKGILFNPFGGVCNLEPTWLTSIRKHLQLFWMVRNKKLENIYVLNDTDITTLLNKKYKRKGLFCTLPDPILILPENEHQKNIKCVRMNPYFTSFLLFGSLSARKGIFLVLNALTLISDEIATRIKIVIAGKIAIQDRKKFYELFDLLKLKKPSLNISLIDGFVPYKKIPELFMNCDCVLIPYIGNNSSSGVIGHAALYEKPVLGPNNGLIGKLINNYNLGITINEIDEYKLSYAIENFFKTEKVINEDYGFKKFVEERHPTKFVETLFR